MAVTEEQDYLSKFRDAADDARYYEDKTDVNLLDNPRYLHFVETGEYLPSDQAFPDNEIDGANFSQGRADGTGAAATQAQLAEMLAALQGMNSGQDVDLSGLGPGDFPTFTMPGENLSPAIDQTLLGGMEGYDPLNLEDMLSNLLSRTAGGGFNSERLFNRQEAARENLTQGQIAATNDLRGVLAERGLIGTPGHPEGAELDATMRAFEPLQRAYLGELRQSEFDESVRADEAEMAALTQATGWSRDQAAQRLAAADQAGGRQQMFADIALKNLAQNADWNKFLAQFGLQREALENEIRRGNIDGIMPMLTLIMQFINASRGGHI
jgi:hypothetical protein